MTGVLGITLTTLFEPIHDDSRSKDRPATMDTRNLLEKHVAWIPLCVCLDWYSGDSEWEEEKGINFGLFSWEPGTGYPMHASDTLDIGVIWNDCMD